MILSSLMRLITEMVWPVDLSLTLFNSTLIRFSLSREAASDGSVFSALKTGMILLTPMFLLLPLFLMRSSL